MQRLTNKLFGVVAAGLLMLLMAAPGLAQVTVNVANSVEGEAGDTGAIGVYVSSLDGEGVLSYDLTVEYDPSILTISGYNAVETLSADMSIDSSSPTNSTFQVAAATGTALSGAGTLIWLTYEFEADGTSSIELTNFELNDGAVAVTDADVVLRLPHTGAEPDEDFVLPVFASDIGGQGALSYNFTVDYDSDVVTFSGVQTAGTISENATVVANAGDGTIEVAGAQGTAFTSGNGVLVYLVGRSADVEGMTTALTFSDVSVNDANPPSSGSIDGSLEVGTGSDAETPSELPGSFALHGNYPNPFNPSTTLRFDLPESAVVSVEIVDLLGRQVMTLPARTMQAGANHNLEIDASALPSGTYLYRVTARSATDTMVQSGQMMLVK